MNVNGRTAGKTKRDNLDENEDLLLMKTLRDMNLSKLIAQDVPLFLSLLGDLFPTVVAGSSADAHAEVKDVRRSNLYYSVPKYNESLDAILIHKRSLHFGTWRYSLGL